MPYYLRDKDINRDSEASAYYLESCNSHKALADKPTEEQVDSSTDEEDESFTDLSPREGEMMNTYRSEQAVDEDESYRHAMGGGASAPRE